MPRNNDFEDSALYHGTTHPFNSGDTIEPMGGEGIGGAHAWATPDAGYAARRAVIKSVNDTAATGKYVPPKIFTVTPGENAEKVFTDKNQRDSRQPAHVAADSMSVNNEVPFPDGEDAVKAHLKARADEGMKYDSSIENARMRGGNKWADPDELIHTNHTIDVINGRERHNFTVVHPDLGTIHTLSVVPSIVNEDGTHAHTERVQYELNSSIQDLGRKASLLEAKNMGFNVHSEEEPMKSLTCPACNNPGDIRWRHNH